MKLTPHLYPYYPKRMVNFYGLSSYMPLNAAFEGEAIQGSGCNFGKYALCGAMGEFIERRHFFSDIPTDAIGKIHDYNSKAVSEKFYDAINQIKVTQDDPHHFNFQLTKVKNIFDDTDAYIPKRFISLGKITLADEQFVPLMDSSGIAVHGTKELSLQTSLHEFIERQALVGSWLSECDVIQHEATVLYEIKNLQRLAQQLLTFGELYIFDISNELPGYTIAICYFSKSLNDKVQYVIGVATEKTFLDALESALSELWQDYLYIYCYTIYENSGDDFLLYAGDTYHMSHFQDNTLSTRNLIPYFKHAKTANTFNKKIFSHEDLLENLRNISEYIYGYFNKDVNDDFYYSRVLSPDFYLHMSIHKPLNFMNQYAKRLHIGDVPLNRQRIPFP